MESRENLSTETPAGAVLSMGAEVIAKGRIHSKFKFELWRRRKDCTCNGCYNYALTLVTLAQVSDHPDSFDKLLGRADLQCEFRELAWVENVDNIVVTVGKNDILTQYFKGSSYTAAWFIGLVDGGGSPTYAAGDTAASHAGWTENTGYSQATRPAWTGGTASAGSIDNSGSPAVYSINAGGTIAGAFSITNSTKGGTSGTLYSEVNFSGGSRAVLGGDTLNVTQTFTVS